MIPIISKNQIKYIRSLNQIKFRKQHQRYLVEGIKNAEEWIKQGADIETLVALQDWHIKNTALVAQLDPKIVFQATEEDFEKISGFKTPNQVLLVVRMPEKPNEINIPANEWALVLDKVQDPGNFGTIIRTADWFGIHHIICSNETVEAYNPKVIQATMGSLIRVNIHYTNLDEFLKTNKEIPSYAAVLGGQSLDASKAFTPGFIVMGNESKGISPELQELVTECLTIPRIGQAESLNVAVATGIMCHSLIK